MHWPAPSSPTAWGQSWWSSEAFIRSDKKVREVKSVSTTSSAHGPTVLWISYLMDLHKLFCFPNDKSSLTSETSVTLTWPGYVTLTWMWKLLITLTLVSEETLKIPSSLQNFDSAASWPATSLCGVAAAPMWPSGLVEQSCKMWNKHLMIPQGALNKSAWLGIWITKSIFFSENSTYLVALIHE